MCVLCALLNSQLHADLRQRIPDCSVALYNVRRQSNLAGRNHQSSGALTSPHLPQFLYLAIVRWSCSSNATVPPKSNLFIIIIIIAGMAVCGGRLFTLSALLFVVFDVFYRDSVLGVFYCRREARKCVCSHSDRQRTCVYARLPEGCSKRFHSLAIIWLSCWNSWNRKPKWS